MPNTDNVQLLKDNIKTCEHLKDIVDTQDFRDFLTPRHPCEILLASLTF